MLSLSSLPEVAKKIIAEELQVSYIHHVLLHVLFLAPLSLSLSRSVSLSLSLPPLSQTTLTQLRSVVSPFIQEVQKMLSQMIESMHGENFGG